MNVDRILDTMNRDEVAYILIGGMNFLLRHAPVLTYDVDLWIEDTPENLHRCETALAELEAQWGESDADWKPVARRNAGWLNRQMVFCLTSPHGSIDIFRSVRGLESWASCRARAVPGSTSAGVSFPALCDQDMLQCQMALPEGQRHAERIRALQQALEHAKHE
jgi:hypothetical protein